MSRSSLSGSTGEQTAELVLRREGWKITGRQVVLASGHKLDLVGIHPVYGDEWLIEVKTWGVDPSGKDTIKKAIADAYDLQQLGEERSFLLVMSHRLEGLYGGMLRRARAAGAIKEVRVLETVDYYGQDGE